MKKASTGGDGRYSRREMIAKSGLGLFAALAMAGCNEDNRETQEKLDSPRPDFNTRQVMACPKCGNPTAPYRISNIKSFYKCSGNPPKFATHDTREWTHTLKHDDETTER